MTEGESESNIQTQGEPSRALTQKADRGKEKKRTSEAQTAMEGEINT